MWGEKPGGDRNIQNDGEFVLRSEIFFYGFVAQGLLGNEGTGPSALPPGFRTSD